MRDVPRKSAASEMKSRESFRPAVSARDSGERWSHRSSERLGRTRERGQEVSVRQGWHARHRMHDGGQVAAKSRTVNVRKGKKARILDSYSVPSCLAILSCYEHARKPSATARRCATAPSGAGGCLSLFIQRPQQLDCRCPPCRPAIGLAPARCSPDTNRTVLQRKHLLVGTREKRLLLLGRAQLFPPEGRPNSPSCIAFNTIVARLLYTKWCSIDC